MSGVTGPTAANRIWDGGVLWNGEQPRDRQAWPLFSRRAADRIGLVELYFPRIRRYDGCELSSRLSKLDSRKSSLITEENPFFDRFGGIHHVYANGPALRAMKKQIPNPDDAVLVFDLLSAVRVDGGLISGERRRIDVMQRGQQRFPKTDGWGYASFKGSGEERVAQDVTEACHGCHVNGLGELQTVNGVFSAFPE